MKKTNVSEKEDKSKSAPKLYYINERQSKKPSWPQPTNRTLNNHECIILKFSERQVRN